MAKKTSKKAEAAAPEKTVRKTTPSEVASASGSALSATSYIADREQYEKVLAKVPLVRNNLWIATADIKDLHVKTSSGTVPFLGIVASLIERGVGVRLMHAKEPGPLFREDFDRYPILAHSLEHVLCPRIHFKLMIFDFTEVYIGSANLTGAGIGMKSPRMRNFEAGILSSDLALVDSAAEHFDSVWRGALCKDCGRRQYCPDPIA